MNRGNRRVGKT